MALSFVNPQDATKRFAQLAGSTVDSFEALSDLLRAEVHARTHAPRAATISRLARLLAPAALVKEERLDEVCDALEREGDLMLTPGGILYATPMRVVTLKTHARLFGSLPTRILRAVFNCEVAAVGAARTVAKTDDLAEAVAKISGALITPDAWAGLDVTPNANVAFLDILDQRLEWEASSAGALEHDGALEWRTWEVTDEAARWRRSNEGRLWWARTRFGGHHRAWTAGMSPSTSEFVELNFDDADRARFALARKIVGASKLQVKRSGKSVTVEVPAWLPRAEYRWLSLHAVRSPDSKGMRWDVAADDEALVTKLLVERLGLVLEFR